MIPAMSAGGPFQQGPFQQGQFQQGQFQQGQFQQGQFQQGQNTALGNTPVSELELRKRMLDNNREVQLKYADMEADKQKKLEDKAEKHRVKAAKWKARHMEAFVHRHEKKCVKLEQKAHTHYMKAEEYKAAAKQIETERKQYDPPSDKKEEKKPAGKKSDDKKDEKKDDKTPAGPGPKTDETKKDIRSSTDHTQQQPSTGTQNQQEQPNTTTTGTSPMDPNRPKRAPIQEKRDWDSRYQQDVSTAAIRNSKANDPSQAAQEQMYLQQQTGATGLGRP